jgi:hypothetical protein
VPASDSFCFVCKPVEVDRLAPFAAEREEEVTLADQTELGRAAVAAEGSHRTPRRFCQAASSASSPHHSLQ